MICWLSQVFNCLKIALWETGRAENRYILSKNLMSLFWISLCVTFAGHVLRNI